MPSPPCNNVVQGGAQITELFLNIVLVGRGSCNIETHFTQGDLLSYWRSKQFFLQRTNKIQQITLLILSVYFLFPLHILSPLLLSLPPFSEVFLCLVHPRPHFLFVAQFHPSEDPSYLEAKEKTWRISYITTATGCFFFWLLHCVTAKFNNIVVRELHLLAIVHVVGLNPFLTTGSEGSQVLTLTQRSVNCSQLAFSCQFCLGLCTAAPSPQKSHCFQRWGGSCT